MASVLKIFVRGRFSVLCKPVAPHLCTYRYNTKEARFMSYKILYSEYGDPPKILSKQEFSLPQDLGQDEVLVKMLAAPINPADINMIQGTYPVKPSLPAIGGNEGVAEVLDIGPGVASLTQGDLVIPAFSGWGTWRTHAQCKASDLKKLNKNVDVISASMLSVNPCTAYRMLKDFQTLYAGDTVIQNGANSGVGQAVIQIAAAKGINTINVVRNRDTLDELKTYLQSLGATYVVTDEEARSLYMKDIFKVIPAPKLALNCVGGKSATELVRHLGNQGTMVTYGGMSKQPVIMPTGLLIFKDITSVGYWMTRWNTENKQSQESRSMIDELCSLIIDGRLKPPKHELNRLSDYKDAVDKAMQPLTSVKQIFTM